MESLLANPDLYSQTANVVNKFAPFSDLSEQSPDVEAQAVLTPDEIRREYPYIGNILANIIENRNDYQDEILLGDLRTTVTERVFKKLSLSKYNVSHSNFEFLTEMLSKGCNPEYAYQIPGFEFARNDRDFQFHQKLVEGRKDFRDFNKWNKFVEFSPSPENNSEVRNYDGSGTIRIWMPQFGHKGLEEKVFQVWFDDFTLEQWEECLRFTGIDLTGPILSDTDVMQYSGEMSETQIEQMLAYLYENRGVDISYELLNIIFEVENDLDERIRSNLLNLVNTAVLELEMGESAENTVRKIEHELRTLQAATKWMLIKNCGINPRVLGEEAFFDQIDSLGFEYTEFLNLDSNNQKIILDQLGQNLDFCDRTINFGTNVRLTPSLVNPNAMTYYPGFGLLPQDFGVPNLGLCRMCGTFTVVGGCSICSNCHTKLTWEEKNKKLLEATSYR